MNMKLDDNAILKSSLDYLIEVEGNNTDLLKDKNTIEKIFSLVSDEYIILERSIINGKLVEYIKNAKNEYLHKINGNFIFNTSEENKIDLKKIIKYSHDILQFDIDRVKREYSR